jgi:glycine cleavage system H protein
MRLSRREFIKSFIGLVGGTSLAISSCSQKSNSPETTSREPTNTTTSPLPTTSTTSTVPPLSSQSETSVPTSNPASPTTNTAFIYVPSREGLELQLVPGCTSFVAMDRMYTVEHVWVKKVLDDVAVLGITDKMQLLMERITELSLARDGEQITRGDTFGYAEGDKMSVDLMAPVTGEVIQVNNELWAGGGENKGFDTITGDPYVNGWMIAVKISKPAELNELITPEEYMALNAKTTTT